MHMRMDTLVGRFRMTLPLRTVGASVQIALLCAIAWLLVATAATAQSEARASMGGEVTNFNVGDAVRIFVFVEHAAGARVILPTFDETWGEIEVRDVALIGITPNQSQGETTELHIEVTAWEPGSYTTPDLDLKIASPDGNLGTVSASGVSLTVDSVLNPEDLNLRDIKDQATVPFPSSRPLYFALAGLAAAALLASVFLLRRSRRRPDLIGLDEEEEDLRPAHVIALESLTQIERRNLPASGEFKEHYTQVSDTVRRYLEKGFNIQAMEATTFEIRRSLRKETKLDIAQRAQVERVLQEADLVKFAKAMPDMADAVQLPKTAREFVSATQALIVVEEVDEDALVSAETTQPEEPTPT